MTIKGGQLSTLPDYFIVTVGKKRYKAYSLRDCFKAANGRWPLKGELDKFIDSIARGG